MLESRPNNAHHKLLHFAIIISNVIAFTSTINYPFLSKIKCRRSMSPSVVAVSQFSRSSCSTQHLSMTTTDPTTSSSSSSSPPPRIVERLNLTRQFERWAILQDLIELDLESDADDINEIIYLVLKSHLDIVPSSPDRPKKKKDGNTGPDIDETAHSIIRRLVAEGDETDGRVVVFKDPACVVADEEVVKDLDSLLPLEEEDNDAYMSLWEIVIALYGMENVKMSQRENDPEWNARCIATRFLIHYDFLTEGIQEFPKV